MDATKTLDLPLIEVRIETAGVVPAAEVGRLIEEVARGFERHARGKGRRDLRLGIKRVDIGSLVVTLVVTGGRPSPGGADVARSFVDASSRLVLIAQGLMPGSIGKVDVRLVDALAAPVRDGTADGVAISAPGALARVVVDRDAVRRLDESRAKAPPRLARPSPPPAQVTGRDSPPRLRKLEDATGTVFDVKGRWYVRLEGEGGVLNPLEPDRGVEVEDGGLYGFDGSWEGTSYRISAARRIG